VEQGGASHTAGARRRLPRIEDGEMGEGKRLAWKQGTKRPATSRHKKGIHSQSKNARARGTPSKNTDPGEEEAKSLAPSTKDISKHVLERTATRAPGPGGDKGRPSHGVLSQGKNSPQTTADEKESELSAIAAQNEEDPSRRGGAQRFKRVTDPSVNRNVSRERERPDSWRRPHAPPVVGGPRKDGQRRGPRTSHIPKKY